MQSCSSLRIETQQLALTGKSDDLRMLASLVSVLCAKMEELELELREMRLKTGELDPDQPMLRKPR